MRYWVRLDKERVLSDYNEQNLLESSKMESIYLIRQMRFCLDYGNDPFMVNDADINFQENMVMMSDYENRCVYVPCNIEGITCNG